MKHLNIVFAFLLLAAPVFAQVIPNYDMETWISSGTYDEPQGWSTPNPYLPGIQIVSKSTDAHGGSFAAKLEAANIIIVTVPGVMGTGAIDPTAFNITGGFPVNTAYAEFSGYFKFYPKGTDTCWIFAALTKWNTTTASRDTLAFANFLGGSTPSYTKFTAPFFYLLQDVPDSAIVVAVTSKNILLGSDSTVLYVDDFAFSGVVGIDEVPDGVIQAYPNPAKDKFIIKLSSSGDAKYVTVFDVLGNKIKTVKIEAKEVLINTSAMADGIYFYQLEDNTGKPLASGKFSVKR